MKWTGVSAEAAHIYLRTELRSGDIDLQFAALVIPIGL